MLVDQLGSAEHCYDRGPKHEEISSHTHSSRHLRVFSEASFRFFPSLLLWPNTLYDRLTTRLSSFCTYHLQWNRTNQSRRLSTISSLERLLQKLIPLGAQLIIVNSRPAPNPKNTGRKLAKPNVLRPGQCSTIVRSLVSRNDIEWVETAKRIFVFQNQTSFRGLWFTWTYINLLEIGRWCQSNQLHRITFLQFWHLREKFM